MPIPQSATGLRIEKPASVLARAGPTDLQRVGFRDIAVDGKGVGGGQHQRGRRHQHEEQCSKRHGCSPPLGGLPILLFNQFSELSPSRGDRLVTRVRPESHFLRPYEGNVSNTDELKELAQIRLLKVHCPSWTVAVEACPYRILRPRWRDRRDQVG